MAPGSRFYTGQSFNQVVRSTKRSVSDGSASFLLFVRVVLLENTLEVSSGRTSGGRHPVVKKTSCRPHFHCANWSCSVTSDSPPRRIESVPDPTRRRRVALNRVGLHFDAQSWMEQAISSIIHAKAREARPDGCWPSRHDRHPSKFKINQKKNDSNILRPSCKPL